MLESHLTKLLGKVGKAGERIVCFVLLYDEIKRVNIQVEGLSNTETSEAIRLCGNQGL